MQVNISEVKEKALNTLVELVSIRDRNK